MTGYKMTKHYVVVLAYLLVIIVLFGSPAWAQSPQPYLPAGNGAPLSQLEAKIFTQAICRSDLPATRGTCGQVKDDADYLLELGSFYRMNFILYGSFSHVGVQEALIGLSNYETDAGSTSAVLFRRDGDQWQATKFLNGGVRRTVLAFPTRDGRTLVVSYGEGAETSSFDLRVTDFGGNSADTSLLLDYKNSFPSCGSAPTPDAEFAEIVGWQQKDWDGNKLLDLVLEVVTVNTNEFSCNAREAFVIATRQPENVEQVVFLFNGQTFTPTQKAKRLKQFSQAPQGYTNTR